MADNVARRTRTQFRCLPKTQSPPLSDRAGFELFLTQCPRLIAEPELSLPTAMGIFEEVSQASGSIDINRFMEALFRLAVVRYPTGACCGRALPVASSSKRGCS